MFAKLYFRVLVRSVFLIAIHLMFSCTPSPHHEPVVLYRRYKPVEGMDRILDTAYLLATEQLPLSVELDDYQLLILGLTVQKGTSGGFSVSMKVEFLGEERNIGFWHGRDPTAPYYSVENGCTLDVTLFCQEDCPGIEYCGGFDCRNPEFYTYGDHSSSDCGGIVMIEVNRWEETPISEETVTGIEGIVFTEWIYLDELDYDYSSGEWNFVKLVLGLQREERLPPIPE